MNRLRNFDNESRFEKKTLVKSGVAVSLLATLALSGCSNAVETVDDCVAYTAEGDVVRPSSYPLGDVKVLFQEARFAGNIADSTNGVISESEDGYVLNVKNIPSELANDVTAFRGTQGAIAINTPETGVIAFSTGCITTGVDDLNLPTTFVELPSEQ